MRPGKLLTSASVRFTAIYFALYLISTAGLLGLIYWVEWSTARAEIDERVDDRIAWLSRDYGDGGANKVVEDIGRRIDSQVRARTFYRFARDGNVLAGNFPSDAGAVAIGRQTLATSAEREGASVSLPMRTRTIVLSDGMLLTVGIDSEQLAETRELFIRVALGVIIGSLLLAPALGYYMSRSLLHPIDLLNRTIASIMAGDFSRRVALRGTRDEFDELSARLNAMLETIQRLMSDLRSTANDVAHDLRTPLSRLRLKLEELRERSEDSGELAAGIDEAVEECAGIVETFNAILKLSEIENEQSQAGFADCDLSDIVETVAEAYAGIADDEGRSLHVASQRDVHVRGNKPLLLQMLSNLLDNAFKHTPAGTAVRLQLGIEGDKPVILVADEGAGIPQAAREQVFNRFHRLERSRTTPGSGLGLSLVAAIARLHDIRIALADAEPGLRVELAFPQAATQSS